MAQYEQSAMQENAAREADSSRRLSPLIILLVAAAFAANAWFFYHQGQRDGANPAAEATSNATPAPSSEPALPPASSPAQSTADNTAAAPPANPAQPAAMNDTAKPAADATSAATPATKSNPKAKSANRLVAKAARPAPSSTAKISDREAILVVRPKPVYPAQALRAGEQGTVLVLAQVDITGRVSDARVARHSGSYVLDHAATNEVRHWTFEPALHNGHPVMASVEVPVSYRLEQ